MSVEVSYFGTGSLLGVYTIEAAHAASMGFEK